MIRHSITFNKVHLFITAFFLVFCGFAIKGHAQNITRFPSQPITIVMPSPPGGPTDTQIRYLARSLEEQLGQTVIVVNRPGAAATLGTANMALTASPDGHTIGVVLASLFRMPHLVQVNYDPLEDFTYIINLTGYNHGIVVRADSPWQNLNDLIEHAKSNPGSVSYGSTGTGSAGHIAMARLAKEANVDMNFIPFKGGSEEFAALLGGHIDVVSNPGWGPLTEAGKVRVLASYGDERIARWNQIPTLKELGYNISIYSPVGIAGPKNMDPAIVKTLHDAFKKAIETNEYQTLLDQNDQQVLYMDSDTYRDFAHNQTKMEKQFVKELNIDIK